MSRYGKTPFTEFWCAWLLLLLPAVLVAGGCADRGPAGSAADQSPGSNAGAYSVVCTTGMVADIVRQVAGSRANVTPLMGEGVDPHLYVPTRSDIVRLRDADVIFYNGLFLEGQMQETFQTLASSGKPVFAVTADISQSELRAPPGFKGHPDPHVWNDVGLWSRTVETVAARLAAYDADHADEYRANATAFREQLVALDAYARQAIASIPEAQRYLVTAHDAFGYFGHAYGIAVESVQGITTESEPGVDDINRLVDLLVTKQIPAIFVESSVSEANLQAVMNGAQSRGWTVINGGTLFSDAMGRAGTHEGTYIGMIDHNVTTIARALGGEVPERGMKGRLAPGGR